MKNQILSKLNAACSWRDTLHVYDTVDSTNTRAKELAKQGAPHGTVLIANAQTGGRGRMGRRFDSQAGMGIYMSVILRPGCQAERLMHLTCAAAGAMCDAVENTTDLRPGIKWINDLVWDSRKLGGILTELSVDPGTGLAEFAIIGIGINCTHSQEDFPAQLQQLAGSLAMATGKPVDRSGLAAAMIEALYDMDRRLLTQKDAIMERYKADCITLGRDITVHQAEGIRHGKALDISPDGGLVVSFADGSTETVQSGEVSVRGLYGYV